MFNVKSIFNLTFHHRLYLYIIIYSLDYYFVCGFFNHNFNFFILTNIKMLLFIVFMFSLEDQFEII